MAKKQPKPKLKPKPASGAAHLTDPPTFAELAAALVAANEAVDTAAADYIGAVATLDEARTTLYAAQNAYRGNPTVANAEAWLDALDAFHGAEDALAAYSATYRSARTALATAFADVQAAVQAQVLGQ